MRSLLTHSTVVTLLCAGIGAGASFACSAGGESADAGGTGGADTGTGGAPGSGSANAGTGGADTGTGGAGTGGTGTGGTTAAFTCPTGYDGKTPTLGTLTPVATAMSPGGENRFLEGPVWVDGSLYVSQLRDWGDPAPSRILKLEGTAFVEFLADASAGTNGLAVDGDGKIVAASQRTHGIFSFSLDAPTSTTPLASTYESKGFNSPNDLTLRGDGNLYFTDPDWNCGSDCPQGAGKNRVYRVKGTTIEATTPPHTKPNGIALSPDGLTLYVGGNDAGIKKYALDAAGKIGAVSDFASVQGVDGMTIDCAGNVYATLNGGGTVEILNPGGTSVGTITGVPGATNVAFGGPERKTLYITHQNNLESVELDIPGYPY